MRGGRLAPLVVLATIAPAAAAQDLSVAGARWLTTPHVADYRVGFSRYRLGPVAVATFGQLVFQGPRSAGHLLAGGGADAFLSLSGTARPYLVGGLSGGFLDLRSGAGLALWHGWGVGAGWELLHGAGLAVALEARYQLASRARIQGLSIGARIGRPLGHDRTSDRRDAAAPAPNGGAARRSPGTGRPRSDAAPIPLETVTAERGGRTEISTALETALASMGAPYQWGGTDQNGFDCSGLIQFAYARAGIAVPRRSADQARSGREVGTEIDRLVPGDILTFSGDRTSAVSHVGLYLGHGRFIHSASNGVTISSLSPDDLTARWWLDRWVGSRRLIN